MVSEEICHFELKESLFTYKCSACGNPISTRGYDNGTCDVCNASLIIYEPITVKNEVMIK